MMPAQLQMIIKALQEKPQDGVLYPPAVRDNMVQLPYPEFGYQPTLPKQNPPFKL